MIVMPQPFVERLTIRSALALGFGLTLGIWVFAGYDFTGRVSKIQRGRD